LDHWDLGNKLWSVSYDLCTEVGKYVGVGIHPKLAQASKILPKRVLQATNMSNIIKHTYFSPLFSPKPPPLPPTTTNHRHELSLLAVGPLHGEEHFNRSGIFKTQLKDLVENEASSPPFMISLR